MLSSEKRYITAKDFLVLAREDKNFINYKNLDVGVNCYTELIHVSQLVDFLKDHALPPSLQLTISKHWNEFEKYNLEEILNALSYVKCPDGFSLRMIGMPFRENYFKHLEKAAMINYCLTSIEYKDGFNGIYMEKEDMEKRMETVTHLCIRNKYLLANPEMEKIICKYFNSTNSEKDIVMGDLIDDQATCWQGVARHFGLFSYNANVIRALSSLRQELEVPIYIEYLRDL